MTLTGEEYSNDELLRIVDRCLIDDARKHLSNERDKLHEQRLEIHKLRTQIESEEWSTDSEERLLELRERLTNLLLAVCDLNIDSIAYQDEIDASRLLNDRVSDSVVAAENRATRNERKQSLNELHHAVEEFGIAQREEDSRKRRDNEEHH